MAPKSVSPTKRDNSLSEDGVEKKNSGFKPPINIFKLSAGMGALFAAINLVPLLPFDLIKTVGGFRNPYTMERVGGQELFNLTEVLEPVANGLAVLDGVFPGLSIIAGLAAIGVVAGVSHLYNTHKKNQHEQQNKTEVNHIQKHDVIRPELELIEAQKNGLNQNQSQNEGQDLEHTSSNFLSNFFKRDELLNGKPETMIPDHLGQQESGANHLQKETLILPELKEIENARENKAHSIGDGVQNQANKPVNQGESPVQNADLNLEKLVHASNITKKNVLTNQKPLPKSSSRTLPKSSKIRF